MGIEQYLQQILSARYGKDVRQSIHDSIYEINEVAKKAEYDASTAPESAKAYAQAALASEQAAEDYKIAAEQAAEQAMSGTPEGYADLVAKVNSIYRQTATSYNIVGTSEGSALAHTIYGMSEQDGTPTPSVPVSIDNSVANFECVGKNLWDTTTDLSYINVTPTTNSDGSLTINETISSSVAEALIYGRTSIFKRLKPSTTYVFSCEGNTKGYLQILKKADLSSPSWITVAVSDVGATTLSFTTESTQYIYWFRIKYVPSTVINETIYPMIILNGVDTTYEGFKSKTITTDITLRAIEVTSNDNYNLVLDGKYYIADTVDWSEDNGYVITRRIGREQVTRANYFVDRGSGVKQINYPMSGYSKYNKKGLSNRFVIQAVNDSTPDNGEFWIDHTQSSAVFFIETDEITSVATGTTWLTNNPTYIDYILATPTTESITSEQAQALLGLKTYDEATSIDATGNIEPSLDLEYSKDRNTALALTGHNLGFKNALKLNDINTALIELGGN